MAKLLKAATAGAAVTAVLGAAGCAAVGNVFYNQLLTRKAVNKKHRPRKLEPATRAALVRDRGLITDPADWYDCIEHEEMILISGRGERLHAEVFTQKEPVSRWALICHGWTNWPEGMALYEKKYYELGFNVLVPYLDGHEKSERDRAGMGWSDRLNVVDWINHLVTLDPGCEIILHGVSMGAATVMMTTGEDLPDNVKCAVEDCGYTTVWDIGVEMLRYMIGLPVHPIIESARAVIKLRADYDIKTASSLTQLQKSKTPTLFLHGTQDDFVPYWMRDVCYDNCAAEKERVSIPDAAHANSATTHPELYWDSVISFISRYINLT